MTIDLNLPKPRPDDVSLIQQVQQNWNQGAQDAALGLLRPRADEGEPWAAAVLAWLLMQRGYPGIEESVTWALKAAEGGLTAQLSSTFNNVMGNLPSYPQLAAYIPDIMRLGPWYYGIDPVGQGWNLIQNGQAELALQIIMVPSPIPYPLADPQLSSILAQARVRSAEIDSAAASSRTQQSEVESFAANARAAIEKARDELETSAGQAGLLVAAVASNAIDARFKADAARNSKESQFSWRAGLVVLGGAATVAVLPVLLHYLGFGPGYSSLEQIILHLVSTAALASFAGVLLARGRSRDHAAQRSNDLSTAMGTVVTYSNQINDEAEKQRFMTVMGQAVLQAHLSSGSKQAADDDSLAKMIALANLVRPSSAAGGATSG